MAISQFFIGMRERGTLLRTKMSKYWNKKWYLASNSDLNISPNCLFEHFMTKGWKEGRDPSPLFSISAYLGQYPDIVEAGVNPLVHYITKGRREGRSLVSIKDATINQAASVSQESIVMQKPDSDSLTKQGSVLIEKLVGVYEPVTTETVEQVRESGMFSGEWYLQSYPDLAESMTGADLSQLIEHYLTCGWLEGRSPGVLFPSRQYVAAHSDLLQLNTMSPLMHYLKHGKNENRILPKHFPVASPQALKDKLYRCQQTEYTKEELIEKIRTFTIKPLISIVMPIYNSPASAFKEAIQSIQCQVYENFELIAVDDGSDDQRAYRYLKNLSKKDKRFTVCAMPQNKGIAEATNKGLSLAQGDYIALMDHDDVLTPDALFWVVYEINSCPNSDFIYSDEAKITPDGQFLDFYIKPDWSPERLMCFMYIGHLNVIKSSLARSILFNSEYNYAQDLDFSLRCTERALCIRHIERILYLWRAVETSVAADITKLSGEKKYIREIGYQAHMAAFQRRGIDAFFIKRPDSDCVSVRSALRTVSIVIASDDYDDISKLADNIYNQTAYPWYEFVIVSNGGACAKIRKKYRHQNNIILVAYHDAPNIARQYNEGVKMSSGEILVFVTPEIEIRDKTWLIALTEYLTLPNISGSCGLVYADERIVHSAGYYAGGYGYITPRLAGYPENINTNTQYGSLQRWAQNVSVLSKEMFALNKAAYDAVGGFDLANTPNMYPIADISLRLLEHGYRNIYTPYAEVYLKAASKIEYLEPPEDVGEELYMIKKWSKYLSHDPYYTQSLRTAIETDPMNRYEMYLPEHIELSAGSEAVLLITHDLNRTGAPMTIYYMAQLLHKAGHFPIVVSPKDGELRHDLTKLDIPVIVDSSLYPHNNAYLYVDHSPLFRLAKFCKITIVNTTETYQIVRGLQSEKLPYIWWLHEGKYGVSNSTGDSSFIDTVKNANEIYLASAYCKQFIRPINSDVNLNVLHYGIEDLGLVQEKPASGETVKFIIVGTFDKRKAQNHVIDAFFFLPNEVKKKIEITMICVVYDEHFFKEQYKRIKDIPQFTVHKTLPHDEVISLMRKSDVVLCPSLDDPMPIVVTEGFMCSKTCVVSDCTGSATLIKHGESGFVVPADKPKALAKTMEYIVMNKSSLPAIGAKARKIFEDNFSLDVFAKNVDKLLFKDCSIDRK